MPITSQDYAELVVEARNRDFPDLMHRDDVVELLPQPAAFNTVNVITGVRRCGKTFYAFQLMNQIISGGFPRDRVFYFDFSDDRLRPVEGDILDAVLDEYWRQVPDARKEGAYLFLDEIQERKDWQGFCRRVAEHEKVTLVVTGSSSKLSADEISTNFRGRSLEHPMSPLSFCEFCRFNGVECPDADELLEDGAVSPKMRTSLEAAFDRYLVVGGFPGVQGMVQGERTRTLQTYARDIVARDVVERFERTDLALATQVALFALRNTSCELSVNALTKRLKKVGYKTSWETVSELIRMFSQVHLIEMVPEYSTSFSSDSTAMQKVYAVDAGLAYAVSRANQQGIGKRLETAVCSELMRRSAGSRMESVTSYTLPSTRRDRVDFLIGDALGTEPYALLQVAAEMEAEKTRKRELSSLDAAMRETGVCEGTVVTLRESGEIETDAGRIRIVPAWQ